MARPDEAKAALRALTTNADLLIHACLEEGGRIIEDSDNEGALIQLRKHRLVFELDEERQFAQVSRVVSELMHHVTESYRRQMSCATASGIVQELESIIEAYRLAWKSSSRDLALREAEAQEKVASLIDALREITQRFTRYIHSEFSYVSDLEQRIHENLRALDEVKALNELFDTLTPAYLMEKAGPISGLQYLLMKVLRRNLDKLRIDMIDASHGLRENLAKLEKDQQALRHNNMIEAFLRHFEQNPTYQPDPGLLEAGEYIPLVYCRVETLEMRAQPDIDDASQHDNLRELLAGALNRQEAREREREASLDRVPVTVRDIRGATKDIPPDPFELALDDFFGALPELTAHAGEVSAMAAHELLEVSEPADVWLLGIYGRYQSYLGEGNPVYRGETIEHQVPRYTGNHVVTDIVFRPGRNSI